MNHYEEVFLQLYVAIAQGVAASGEEAMEYVNNSGGYATVEYAREAEAEAARRWSRRVLILTEEATRRYTEARERRRAKLSGARE